MLFLSISGLFLVARRMGGWRQFFARTRGPLAGRLHVEIGRFSAAGLILSSATALFMVLNPAAMPALADIPVSQLRDLTFPYADDPTDAYTIATNTGEGYVDQGTGEMLAWQAAGPWQQVFEFIYMLHTGQGAWALGLILGLMVLGVPVMVVTGLILWWVARRARPKMPKSVAANKADTVILVGSEGGSTWGFAATLQKALMAEGQAIHTTAMSRFDPAKYTRAKQVVVLAATFGDGAAPASAKGFLDTLDPMETAPGAKLAVLGFGDRQFPAYCAFAIPKSSLLDRLRGRGWKRFQAGDLLGVVPQGSNVARLYSLASGTRDGFIEICVKKHAHGLCSGQLLDLEIGESITAFTRPNPDFRPANNNKPVILIGAGTGIGPLAGFARANRQQRPMHLYFGIRHEASDLFYGEEMPAWQESGQLETINIACSRTRQRAYVQDILRRDGAKIAALIEDGAQVLVCGGREMAAGVAQALHDVLTPRGLCPIQLKSEGRYAEDVY